MRFEDRICVPNNEEIKKMILEEAHKSKLSMHPRTIKMYQDLKKTYWWPKMKRKVAQYVAKCLVCQKAKIEHQKQAGMPQSLDIPEWKWDSITICSWLATNHSKIRFHMGYCGWINKVCSLLTH